MVLYYVCKIIEDSWKRIKKIGQSQLIVNSQLKHLILGSMGLYNKEEEAGEELMARRKHEGRQAPFGVPLVHQVSQVQIINKYKNIFQNQGSRADTYRRYLREAMQSRSNLVVVTQVLFYLMIGVC